MARRYKQKQQTMKTILTTLLLMLAIAGCNAQNDNMRDDVQCGGYRSKNYDTKPLKNVQGELTKIYCTYIDNDQYEPTLVRYEIKLDDTSFNGSISRERGYESYVFNVKKDAKLTRTISKALKESGIMEYNQWNVHVNGLPPITEFYISADFSSGEHFFMEFNGGHSPAGFMEKVAKFNNVVCKLADYSPEKCEKSKPYVSPYLGEHHFTYDKKGKVQHFSFIVENTSGRDNAEVISTGDFGEFHARCNASNVSGRYFFSIISYYDDSKITDVTINSLAGILDHNGGVITLEPLQAAPTLPDRNKLKEEK